jgi:hypothetical protein
MQRIVRAWPADIVLRLPPLRPAAACNPVGPDRLADGRAGVFPTVLGGCPDSAYGGLGVALRLQDVAEDIPW